MSCENCQLEKRVDALEKDSLRNQNTHREFYNRFEELKIDAAGSRKDYQTIMATLAEVKSDVKELKDKPAKRWDQVVEIILQWAIVGLLAANTFIK